VFGAQLLAQVVRAAAELDPAKVVKSAHLVFARPAVVHEPVEVQLAPVQSGRSFASLDVTVHQGDKVCVRALVLLHAPDPDFLRHDRAMPDVPGPVEGAPSGDGFPGRELRVVQEPIAGVEPRWAAWVRFPGAPDDVRTDQALLAYSAGASILTTVMQGHPEVSTDGAHLSMSVGIMTATVALHEPAAASEWVLVAVESPWAGQGRTYGRGDVFRQDGALVASFGQDGMVRPFDQSQAGKVKVGQRI
jgi:acyl-CoA thioesterase